ncbi:MAG: HTH domain-containing protein [Bryobacteraceae bacterium]
METSGIQAHYKAVLSDLQAKKERETQEAIQKVSQKYAFLIASIQAALDGSLDLPNDASQQGMSAMPVSNGEVRITTGEFHGMSYPSAARSILERTNKTPLTTQQILGYIEKSGRKVEGKNPNGTVYSSLKRSPDFELVTKNTWGLAVWYNIKRKTKSEKSTESTPEGELEPVVEEAEPALQEA